MATVKDFNKRRFYAQPANLTLVLPFTHSFETNEQGDIVIYFPFACTVTKIRSVVTKAIAGTDNGTLTAKNNAGTGMTSGVITHVASEALGTEKAVTPSANNTFAAGEKMIITSAKTTAGGKVYGTVEVVTS